MRAKIFKSVLILSLVVLVATTAIVFSSTYNSYRRLALEDAERACDQLSQGYDEFGTEYLYGVSSEGVRVTHVDGGGNVLYDSYISAQDADNHLSREEITAALASGHGSAVRTSETFGRETVYYAILQADGTVIRVAREHYSALTLFLNVLTPVVILLAAVMVIAFVIAAMLVNGIVKPINRIDPNHPEQAQVYDELKPVISRLCAQNDRISRQMRELTARRNEFNSITSNMSEGLAVINANASILSYNKSADEILGINGAQGSILAVRSSEGFRNAILTALGGANGYETVRKEEGVFSLLATPVMNGSRVDGAVLFIVDVTEREERDSLRREFTANVSHELKTPLTSISGFAELIRSGLADGEDARHFADNIYKETARLIDLVGDIIRLNQVEGGQIPYDEDAVSLSDVVSETVDRLAAVASSRGVRIETRIADGVLVDGNRQMLDELVYNLVDNAIKYNTEDGSVTVAVDNGADERDKKGEKDDTGVILRVFDTGIGIPKEAQGRIFERFFRVDKSRSKESGGTGLGLSIVKHAAAFHHAEIELESEVGKGTRITVMFPCPKSRSSVDAPVGENGDG